MAGKTTVACTQEQYEKLITTIFQGIDGLVQPNPRAATILEVEANTGLRIGDVLSLRRGSIIKDGTRYRFDIEEQKTGKKRTFTVPNDVYVFIEDYCDIAGIPEGEIIFPVTVRAVQKHLQRVCELLGYKNISSHSFRKKFASEAYETSGNDIELVRRLLQHSSTAITSRYIGISDKRIDDVLNKNVNLLSLRNKTKRKGA